MAKREVQLAQVQSSKRRCRESLSGFRVPWFFFADRHITQAEKMAIVQSATQAILDGTARRWSYSIPMITRPQGAESMVFHLELDNDNHWYLGRR
jgi:hypothetical protein